MKSQAMRQMIAHAAARLLAEDGSLDYGSAKRKAARQLGAADSRHLPDNQMIEEALRSYQSLYRLDETRSAQTRLRELAIEYMRLLADFDPHLTGSVLNGTAGPHSDVNLQLFTDQEKELEFRLMRDAPEYRAVEGKRAGADGMNHPAFSVTDPRGTVSITVYPRAELRTLKRLTADGSPRRLRLEPFLELTDDPAASGQAA